MEIAPPDRRSILFAQLGHNEALAGDFAAAETWYRETFAVASTDSEDRLYLGEILFRQGKLKEAEASLRMVTEGWNESLSEAWHLLGEVLASQEQYAESLECFKLAAESAPNCRKHLRRIRELKKLVTRSGPPIT